LKNPRKDRFVNIRLYIYTLLEHPLRTENPRDGSGESESEREGRKSVEKERERERESFI
jgi:hypothetical protein